MRRIVGLLATTVTVAASLLFASAGTASADPSANAWYQLRMCESSNRYDINTGNGYYGAYQFDLPTWRSVGGSGYPNQASPAEQDYRALILYRMRGWSPWTCAVLVGLREDGDARSGVMPPRPGNTGSPSPGGSEGGSTSSGRAPAWPGKQYFEGDYSEQLKVWQKQAGKLGYGLVGTGYFGPKTEAAVLAIQKKAKLNVVGFIGPKTWAAAWDTSNAKNAGSGSTVTYTPQTDASCKVGAAKAPAWPGKQFFYGDTARELQCFQKQLGHRGYPLSGTGYYGPATKASVLDLQRRNGINDSGIIGPLTWKAAWEGAVK
ncbi:MAG TPA: peptidoglycan-binding protein [Nakamurella sp.]|nr:peptidoglycan-binding protein [Nakamurella sp.]